MTAGKPYANIGQRSPKSLQAGNFFFSMPAFRGGRAAALLGLGLVVFPRASFYKTLIDSRCVGVNRDRGGKSTSSLAPLTPWTTLTALRASDCVPHPGCALRILILREDTAKHIDKMSAALGQPCALPVEAGKSPRFVIVAVDDPTPSLLVLRAPKNPMQIPSMIQPRGVCKFFNQRPISYVDASRVDIENSASSCN